MNKQISLALLTATLLFATSVAEAARPTPLANAIHLQAQEASAHIQLDTEATLKAQPIVLDVPGVEVGPIEFVDVLDQPEDEGAGALLDSVHAEFSAALRRDLVNKALEVPGMFGLYRYLTANAVKTAVSVAE